MRSVICYASSVILILGIATGDIVGQNVSDGKERFAFVPSEVALVLVASQPNMQVRIEECSLILLIDSNKTLPYFRMRNLSGKRIKRISIGKLNLGGGSGDLTPLEFNSRHPFLPGEMVSPFAVRGERIQWTTDLRKHLGLPSERMITSVVLIIREVVFEDGTVQTDSQTVDSFLDFGNRLDLIS